MGYGWADAPAELVASGVAAGVGAGVAGGGAPHGEYWCSSDEVQASYE
jgi:hypothetical protein